MFYWSREIHVHVDHQNQYFCKVPVTPHVSRAPISWWLQYNSTILMVSQMNYQMPFPGCPKLRNMIAVTARIPARPHPGWQRVTFQYWYCIIIFYDHSYFSCAIDDSNLLDCLPATKWTPLRWIKIPSVKPNLGMPNCRQMDRRSLFFFLQQELAHQVSALLSALTPLASSQGWS